ncbi:hypothetical protein ACWFMH_19565 [Bacillus altitudinis]|uniref:hypothetical protein n=1 Tax=Streptomyces sp. NPDC056144 TaxID=3345726 RepID=UPI0035D5F50D
MAFRNLLNSLSADQITPGTITGSTLQTAATGQRVVIGPGDQDGETAVLMYSGHPGELDPGELSAQVQTWNGQDFPSIFLGAPNTDMGAYAGFLHIRSGTSAGGAYWELNTGDGNGWQTPVAIFARAANGVELAQYTLDLPQPGIGSGYADHTITGDTFDWTNVHGKGFFHYSDAGTDYLKASGEVRGQYGTFNDEGTWTAATGFTSYWKQSTNVGYQTLRWSRGARRARLDGCAMVATSYTGAQQLLTLPDGFRPLKSHYFDVPLVTSGSPAQLGCRVESNGVVTVYSSAALTVDALYDFSKVEFPRN